MSQGIFQIIFFGMFFMGIALFIYGIVVFFSPKARGKLMSKQVQATKYMMENQKENLKDISDDLADATKDGVKTTARAIKEGLTEDDTIYCKHCGATIDSDSTFCKKCGKEQ